MVPLARGGRAAVRTLCGWPTSGLAQRTRLVQVWKVVRKVDSVSYALKEVALNGLSRKVRGAPCTAASWPHVVPGDCPWSGLNVQVKQCLTQDEWYGDVTELTALSVSRPTPSPINM